MPCRELLARVLELVGHTASGEAGESRKAAGVVDWGAPAATFVRVAPLLDSNEYSEAAMRGLIVSIGGLSEGLVKHSWGATLKHLQQAPPSTRQRTAKHFMAILSTCRECKGDTKGGGAASRRGRPAIGS